jgi:hypothetical protein
VKENAYQAQLIKKLRVLFPGCVIQKNDSSYIQGYPDLTIFYRNRWAALEVKASADAPERPNQKIWIDDLNGMSYASFIYPENEEEVLHGLQHAFRPARKTRLS